MFTLREEEILTFHLNIHQNGEEHHSSQKEKWLTT